MAILEFNTFCIKNCFYLYLFSIFYSNAIESY